jgi:hypothetical protein
VGLGASWRCGGADDVGSSWRLFTLVGGCSCVAGVSDASWPAAPTVTSCRGVRLVGWPLGLCLGGNRQRQPGPEWACDALAAQNPGRC